MDPLRSPTARRNKPLLVSAATLTLSSTLSSEHLLALWGSSCSAICQMPRCLPLLPFAQTLITMQAWGRWWFALIRLQFGVCGDSLTSSCTVKVFHGFLVLLLSCSFCFYEGIWRDLKSMRSPVPSSQNPSQTMSLTTKFNFLSFLPFFLNWDRLYSADSGCEVDNHIGPRQLLQIVCVLHHRG